MVSISCSAVLYRCKRLDSKSYYLAIYRMDSMGGQNLGMSKTNVEISGQGSTSTDRVDHDRVNWCGFPVHDMFRRINALLSQVIRLALIGS